MNLTMAFLKEIMNPTLEEINKAGDIFRNAMATQEELKQAYETLNRWRTLHSYPINTFQSTLRVKLKKLDKKAQVASRLKRAPTIVDKLTRVPRIKLSDMQDIAGLRAICTDIAKVNTLFKSYEGTKFSHTLLAKECRNYIDSPKKSGYRGIHLIYQYRNPKVPEFDGFRLEIQIRTRLQHIWATAVETAGLFLNEAFKSSLSSIENKSWLEFFEFISSEFAYSEESPILPQHKDVLRSDILKEIKRLASHLKVKDVLNAVKISAEAITNGGGSVNLKSQTVSAYYIISLNTRAKGVQITGYPHRAFKEASENYAKIEQEILSGAPIQAVLVTAGTIRNLKKAYPNYFLDTDEFLKKLDGILER
jgi:putative GTP pyrophosphokinase